MGMCMNEDWNVLHSNPHSYTFPYIHILIRKDVNV